MDRLIEECSSSRIASRLPAGWFLVHACENRSDNLHWPQRSSLQQGTGLLDETVVSEVEADENLAIGSTSSFLDLVCFLDGRGQRFFNEHMLSRVECGQRDLSMRLNWRDYRDDVDLDLIEHRANVWIELRDVKSIGNRREPTGIGIGGRHNLCCAEPD